MTPLEGQMSPIDRHVRNRELAAKAQRGDVAARDELVGHMKPMLLRLTERWRRDQQTRDDMIQEGNLGVLRAMRDYDEATGAEFVAYAEIWSRAFISRANQANRSIIRMPAHVPDDEVPAFDHEAAEVLDEIPAEEFADSIGRAIVLVSALDRLHPFECWVLCERYGLDRPDSLDRDVFPESAPDDVRARMPKFQRKIVDIAAECGLSIYRVNQAIDDGMANLRAILGDPDGLAIAS